MWRSTPENHLTELLESNIVIHPTARLDQLDKRFKHRPRKSHRRGPNWNALIHGENREILDALWNIQPESFRCIYVDPPYNNQEHYSHYDDVLDHESWLQNVIERIRLLPPLMTDDGSVWISIDDREVHYLKVACDEIFGRNNFITTIIWEQRTTRENRKVFSNNHEYVLVYAKNASLFRENRNPLKLTEELLDRFTNPDDDPRGPWQSVSLTAQAGHATPSQFYEIKAPNGKIHNPPNGRCWAYPKHKMLAEIGRSNVWFGREGEGVPRLKLFLKDHAGGMTPETLWTADEVGTTGQAKKQLLNLFPGELVFDTPKPEALIAQIFQIASNEGDWVLDPYLGSGTGAAVAQKMDRRFVGIEIGRAASSYSARRLRGVIEGDNSGISKDVEWRGGGGFDFFEWGGS
ncbi:MAG: site-specific DNA-methyltransferase [Chloroflexi bacterium]|nr:site-specific DNA-methyltransferase [Chloroflexota bacterium]